jgi:hypothetical protein
MADHNYILSNSGIRVPRFPRRIRPEDITKPIAPRNRAERRAAKLNRRNEPMPTRKTEQTEPPTCKSFLVP